MSGLSLEKYVKFEVRNSFKLVLLIGPLRAHKHTHTHRHTSNENSIFATHLAETKIEHDWLLAAFCPCPTKTIKKIHDIRDINYQLCFLYRLSGWQSADSVDEHWERRARTHITRCAAAANFPPRGERHPYNEQLWQIVLETDAKC